MQRCLGFCVILTLAGCAGDPRVARHSGIADDSAHAARIAPRPGPRNCRWPALDDPQLGARLLDGGDGAPRQAVVFRCGRPRRPGASGQQ